MSERKGEEGSLLPLGTMRKSNTRENIRGHAFTQKRCFLRRGISRGDHKWVGNEKRLTRLYQ